jgi:hypothetical protein
MDADLRAHAILLNGGKLDGTTANDVSEIFHAIERARPPNVVIHFHGGLVDKQQGLKAAKDLIPIYKEAGAYPIIVIWESGWLEVINRNIKAIFQEPLFQRILAYVTRFAKAKINKDTDVTKSVDLDLPSTLEVLDELARPEPFVTINPNLLSRDDGLSDKESQQFEQLLKEDDPFQTTAQRVLQEIARTAQTGSAPGTLMTIEDLDTLSGADEAKDVLRGPLSTSIIVFKCIKVLSTILNRFISRYHHGFYPTIVEELLREFYLGNCGKFLWDDMKKDIDTSFGFAANNGGSIIVRQLSDLSNQRAAPKLTIVGHSAGSIFASRLLRELHTNTQFAQQTKINLIFIAPAIDMKSFAETLRATEGRLAGFRSFGMSDQRERADPILGRLYPYSLLYFVSGVLEMKPDTPLAGMERYHGPPYEGEGFEYIQAVKHFDPLNRPHIFVWSPASYGPGMACDMTSHGGWVKAVATIHSVKHILSSGYDYGTGPR